MDSSFTAADLRALEPFFKGDKNSYLQLRITKVDDLGKLLSFKTPNKEISLIGIQALDFKADSVQDDTTT